MEKVATVNFVVQLDFFDDLEAGQMKQLLPFDDRPERATFVMPISPLEILIGFLWIFKNQDMLSGYPPGILQELDGVSGGMVQNV